MTQEEKAKAYDEALERAQKATRAGSDVAMDIVQYIFPELAESEDERNWKIVMEYVKDDALRDWLEKLKESLHISETCKENADSFTDEDERIRKIITDSVFYQYGAGAEYKDVLDYLDKLEKQKEQKPAPTEDMPYITDEHFFEREPVDSFRYKLAKYMTQNCRKEESPDGYTYHISAETILEMAKEELLKRGVVQKPEGVQGDKGYPGLPGIEAVGGVVHHVMNTHYIVTNQKQLNARLRGIPEGTAVNILICEAKEE